MGGFFLFGGGITCDIDVGSIQGIYVRGMFVLTSFLFAVLFADTRLNKLFFFFFLVAHLQGSRIKSLGEGLPW